MRDESFDGEIASEDDEDIARALLEWSGLAEAWNDQDLSRLFNFATGIAFECEDIIVETKEWSNLPGHGGIWYTVSTVDEDGLRAEMEARFHQLVSENQQLIKQNAKEVEAAGRERAKQVAGGPVRKIEVTDQGTTLFMQTFDPDIRHELGVSVEDWRDILSGQPIQYPDVLYYYKDLLFHETWRFNIHKEGSELCHKEGSVWVESEGEEPAFVGTLDQFEVVPEP